MATFIDRLSNIIEDDGKSFIKPVITWPWHRSKHLFIDYIETDIESRSDDYGSDDYGSDDGSDDILYGADVINISTTIYPLTTSTYNPNSEHQEQQDNLPTKNDDITLNPNNTSTNNPNDPDETHDMIDEGGDEGSMDYINTSDEEQNIGSDDKGSDDKGSDDGSGEEYDYTKDHTLIFCRATDKYPIRICTNDTALSFRDLLGKLTNNYVKYDDDVFFDYINEYNRDYIICKSINPLNNSNNAYIFTDGEIKINLYKLVKSENKEGYKTFADLVKNKVININIYINDDTDNEFYNYDSKNSYLEKTGVFHIRYKKMYNKVKLFVVVIPESYTYANYTYTCHLRVKTFRNVLFLNYETTNENIKVYNFDRTCIKPVLIDKYVKLLQYDNYDYHACTKYEESIIKQELNNASKNNKSITDYYDIPVKAEIYNNSLILYKSRFKANTSVDDILNYLIDHGHLLYLNTKNHTRSSKSRYKDHNTKEKYRIVNNSQRHRQPTGDLTYDEINQTNRKCSDTLKQRYINKFKYKNSKYRLSKKNDDVFILQPVCKGIKGDKIIVKIL